jgi:PAS domain-containing protein
VPGVVYQYKLRPDGSSCFPYASEGIRDIYRVTPEQVREDASAVFAVLHPDDYDQVARAIQESAEKMTPWKQEYRVRFPDGTVNWLAGNATPERGPMVPYSGTDSSPTSRAQARRRGNPSPRVLRPADEAA